MEGRRAAFGVRLRPRAPHMLFALGRHGALLLVALAACVLGVGQEESASVRCARAAEQGQWREARSACYESHVSDGNPADVIPLAKAELQLGHDGEAERLATGALDGPWRAPALTVLGTVLDRAGQREAARTALREAIAMFEQRGQARELSRAWFALAGSFWRDRLLSETLDALSASLDAAENADDERMRGLIALMHGDVMRSIGDARSAERDYEQAAAQLQSRPADLAYVDLKQGILRQEGGMLNLAKIAFQRALERAQNTGSQEAVAAARQNLAYNAHLSGDTEAGFAQIADWQGPFDFSHYSVRAMLEADAGRLSDALASMDRAIALSRSSDAWWAEFERGQILERLGDEDAAEQSYERSIAIVEQMRAAMEYGELQPWMIPRRRRPYEALLALFVRQKRIAEAVHVLEAFSARSFMDALIANGSLLTPQLAAGDGTSAWQRLAQAGDGTDDLALALAGRELIVPVEILGRLFVAYKPADGEMRFIDRGDAAHVRELAARFAADPDDAQLASELGSILIPEDVEPAARSLYVVASGWLAAFPYAALRRGGSFLVEQRPLAAVPSLRSFSQLRPPPPPGIRLVLADADGTLPAARAEAADIARALGTDALLADEATSARIESAGPLELLHLGTHAGLDGSGAWLSLADGRWTTDAVLDSGVSARVVVLAACSSAATHHEEVWGSLAVAFLANGSGSVIASLGSIDDDATRSVMHALYQADLGRHPVRALAEAQRSLAATMPPHTWAKFVVYTTADQ